MSETQRKRQFLKDYYDEMERCITVQSRACTWPQLPILIACECSQIEMMAWRAYGFEAYSCDIQPCHGPRPEWHIQSDALELLLPGRWGLIIAHPPCTYLSAVGAVHMHQPGRDELRDDAARFFMHFFNFRDCPMAIENPRPLHVASLPAYNQVIDPRDFGSEWSKRTCLWLYDLPPLLPTHARGPVKSYIYHTRGSKLRSMGFPELALAYVQQWGPYVRASR